uniref:NADH-ubiquinone oxidoreductase chain 6 n=1 Tax=Chaceon sp. BZ-2016 TaxID=1920239 RepID=A0A1L2K1V8_9EUCA|nr:NADH dehydrogenase subunit 6 [Chaceon sp. BZ-2016]
MTLMIIPMTLMLSLLFTRLIHPLSMGLTLLAQTIAVSLLTGVSTYSFWFSYILFMIFLGGMLVLFIYVSSLASNEFFSFSLLNFFFYFTAMIFFSILLMSLDSLMVPFLTSTPPSVNTISISTPFIISWIYSSTLMTFTLFIIMYLLLTLIVVVKITNLFKGPLRLSV